MSINKLLDGYLGNTMQKNEHNDHIKKPEDIKEYGGQEKLILLIDNEFKKWFIKKLYPNPLLTNRVYWNVIGKIQNEHEDIQLDNIIKGVDKYLEENNMCISQRDVLKFIRESIISHQIEGKTKIEDVSTHATENGVTIDRFNEAIKRMKADGSIFEPAEGFYKCV